MLMSLLDSQLNIHSLAKRSKTGPEDHRLKKLGDLLYHVFLELGPFGWFQKDTQQKNHLVF